VSLLGNHEPELSYLNLGEAKALLFNDP